LAVVSESDPPHHQVRRTAQRIVEQTETWQSSARNVLLELVQSKERMKIPAMRLRVFIAIFPLLLCAIEIRADKPIVVKDKEVEVRGRVVSVTISPLGTTFINFGGEYPNQTFAGFIAAGSAIAGDQRLTMIQGKIISITGRIELREKKPEINVVSADQIKGLDSQTER
jgi:hypothetical protein